MKTKTLAFIAISALSGCGSKTASLNNAPEVFRQEIELTTNPETKITQVCQVMGLNKTWAYTNEQKTIYGCEREDLATQNIMVEISNGKAIAYATERNSEMLKIFVTNIDKFNKDMPQK